MCFYMVFPVSHFLDHLVSYSVPYGWGVLWHGWTDRKLCCVHVFAMYFALCCVCVGRESILVCSHQKIRRLELCWSSECLTLKMEIRFSRNFHFSTSKYHKLRIIQYIDVLFDLFL